MSNEISEYSTAWLLMAIYFAKDGTDDKVPKLYHKMEFSELLMGKYKNILPIIFMGDFINKAIFTDSELILGIQYLLDREFITIKEGFLVVTEKFEPVYEETSKKMKYKKKKISLDVIKEVLFPTDK